MNDMIEIEGGEVTASLEDRTITGLLIPYNEMGRTNVGQFEVQAGVIRIPADPSVVSLNLDHDRFAPVGRATRVWEEPAGIMATFSIARTPEGDAALADATSPTGKRRRLSGEFKTGIKAQKATGGNLAAGALVERGAFPSAMVLAADTPDMSEPAPESSYSSSSVDRFTDADGVEWERVSTSTSTTTVTQVGDSEETTDTTTEQQPNTESESEVTATAIPATQRGTAPTTVEVADRGPDTRAVLAAIATLRDPLMAGDRDAAQGVLAALSDITPAGLLDGGSIARPNWLGQLYQGIPYVREYITLGTLGNDITLAGKEGYTLHRGTSGAPVSRLGGTWAGNKTPIPSGVGFSKNAVSDLARYAFGADIAREFFDLPGGAEALDAFFRLVLEDHLVWSDELALETWRTTAGLPVAAKTYPNVDGHDYEGALGMVIQGILAVKAKKSDGRRDVPTFIIANELAFEQLIYTPKDLVPEFVNFTASTDWQGSGDGLRLVVGDTGITSTPAVIVGAGRAVEFDELAGGPLRIDALDIAKGGVDKAVHGYLQRFVVRPEAVVQIGTADARANTTDYAVGDLAKVSSVVYQAVVAGTSSGTAPTAPAVGATVEDGTVTWLRLV